MRRDGSNRAVSGTFTLLTCDRHDCVCVSLTVPLYMRHCRLQTGRFRKVAEPVTQNIVKDLFPFLYVSGVIRPIPFLAAAVMVSACDVFGREFPSRLFAENKTSEA